MIKYKVVTSKRKSAMCEHMPRGLPLTYKKNATIKAKEGTLGVMIFDRLHQARSFQESLFGGMGKTLRVQPIGKGRKPPKELPRTWNYQTLKDIIVVTKSLLTGNWVGYEIWRTPKGTMCYPAVKVLE